MCLEDSDPPWPPSDLVSGKEREKEEKQRNKRSQLETASLYYLFFSSILWVFFVGLLSCYSLVTCKLQPPLFKADHY